MLLHLSTGAQTGGGNSRGGGGGTGGGVKAACIHGADQVQTHSGTKRIDQLEIGDHVAVDEGRFEPIIAFLHRDESRNANGFRFTTSNGTKLTLSDEHLVFVTPYRKAILAKNVKVGHRLYLANENGYVEDAVVEIQRSVVQGRFSPLTPSGAILVNDVMVSCYSQIEDHHLMHRVVHWLLPYTFSGNELGFGKSVSRNGIHWVGEMLWHHFRFWFIDMGNDMKLV